MQRIPWRFLVAVVMLAGTLAASRLADRRRKPDTLVAPLDTIPAEIDGWVGSPTARLNDHVEARLAATEYLSRVYRRRGQEMGLLVVYYAVQRAGESMHSPKACLPAAGWEPSDYSVVVVPVDNEAVRVNLYKVQKDSTRMQVLYWYQSRKRIIASEYAGKALLLWDSMTDGRTGGSLVRLMIADRPDAVADEIRFASRMIPKVQKCLGR